MPRYLLFIISFIWCFCFYCNELCIFCIWKGLWIEPTCVSFNLMNIRIHLFIVDHGLKLNLTHYQIVRCVNWVIHKQHPTTSILNFFGDSWSGLVNWSACMYGLIIMDCFHLVLHTNDTLFRIWRKVLQD